MTKSRPISATRNKGEYNNLTNLISSNKASGVEIMNNVNDNTNAEFKNSTKHYTKIKNIMIKYNSRN